MIWNRLNSATKEQVASKRERRRRGIDYLVYEIVVGAGPAATSHRIVIDRYLQTYHDQGIDLVLPPGATTSFNVVAAGRLLKQQPPSREELRAYFSLERVATDFKIPVTSITLGFMANPAGAAFELSSSSAGGTGASRTTSGPLTHSPPHGGRILGLQFTTDILQDWSRAQLIEDWPEMTRLLRAGTPSIQGDPLRAPPVGGVYLGGAAKFIDQMSELSAACYDPALGRILLIGRRAKDPRKTLPHLEARDLATAARVILTEASGEAPGVSIDPAPEDPRGPTMNVRYLGGVEDTPFGKILFEADRVMKSLSLGRDNVTSAPATCAVTGYHNLLELGFSDLAKGSRNELWSRFWLVPHEIVMSVTDDRTGVRFEEARIRVRTETMRWQGSELVSAGGIKDKPAEYFAAHFSAHYEEIAAEFPVFARLRELAKMVAMLRWVRKAGLPFEGMKKLQSLEVREPTVRQTPSLRVEDSRTWEDSTTIHTQTLKLFGGVDLTVEDAFVKDPGPTGELVSRIQTSAIEHGVDTGWILPTDDLVVAALPGKPRTLPGGLEVHAPGSWPEGLAWAPGCGRVYSSLRNDPGPLGPGWVLALPSLDSRNPQDANQERLLWVEGHEDQKVPERHYILYSPTGGVLAEFREHFVDQDLARIAYRAEEGHPARLYPLPEGRVEIRNGSQVALIFGKDGKICEASRGTTRIEYQWSSERLSQITIRDDPRPLETITAAYDTEGRLTELKGPSGIESYRYDVLGRLKQVSQPRVIKNYVYDDRGRLAGFETGDAPPISFMLDDIGRLVQVRSGEASLLDLVYRVKEGRTWIDATRPGGEEFTAEFDAEGWMRSQSSSSSPTGRQTFQVESRNRIRIQGAAPENTTIEYDPEEHKLAVAVGKSVHTQVDLDALGQPTRQQFANGTWTWMRDPSGHVSEVTWQPADAGAKPVKASIHEEPNGSLVEKLQDGTLEISLVSESGMIREVQYQGKVARIHPAGKGRSAQVVMPDGQVIDVSGSSH